ncbi:MAG: archease [archaeon]
MNYRFLEHTADVKFHAEGKTPEEAFVSAAGALDETIRGDISIAEGEEKSFEVSGKDLEGLLYNFLEEFLFLLDSENFLVSRVKEINIDRENFKLKATVIGDSAENYSFTNDVKAITYNEMYVRNEDDSWKIQVVLDV